MAAVQVRSLPDDVYQALVCAAQEDDRSIAQQVTVFIKQGLARRQGLSPSVTGVVDEASGAVYPSHRVRRAAVLQRLEEQHEKGNLVLSINTDEIDDIIREGYEERAERTMSCLS